MTDVELDACDWTILRGQTAVQSLQAEVRRLRVDADARDRAHASQLAALALKYGPAERLAEAVSRFDGMPEGGSIPYSEWKAALDEKDTALEAYRKARGT